MVPKRDVPWHAFLLKIELKPGSTTRSKRPGSDVIKLEILLASHLQKILGSKRNIKSNQARV
jgi:hypothetical protein